MQPWRVLAFGLAMLSAPEAFAGNCSFAKRPPITVKHNGLCNFNFETLSYAGSPAEQADCLLTPVKRGGFLGEKRATMPPFFVSHVGLALELPDKAELAKLLNERGLGDMAASLDQPVSRGNDNDPKARAATYFVIHDTSTPNYGALPWPVSIDTDPKINNLKRYACDNDIERAHTFINRQGAVLFAHDFSVPWRATKFEMAANFDGKLKGLFLHNELIQPRRRATEFRGNNDYEAPDPGFSSAQYETLALVYAAASVRAGFWMVPAFHSVIDEKIPNKHDDPQNFRLEDFAAALDGVRERLKQQR
jgi:hypothetical protein